MNWIFVLFFFVLSCSGGQEESQRQKASQGRVSQAVMSQVEGDQGEGGQGEGGQEGNSSERADPSKRASTLTPEQQSDVDESCEPYAKSYLDAINKSDPKKLGTIDAKAQIKGLCLSIMKRRVLKSGGVPERAQILTPTATQERGVLGIIDIPEGAPKVEKAQAVGSGLQLAGNEPDTGTEVSKEDGESGNDILEGVIESGLSPILGAAVAGEVAKVFSFLTNGRGAGFSISAGGAAGGGAATVGYSVEAVYHRHNNAGEVGFFCTPTVGFGLGAGVGAESSVYLVKTLGCKDTSAYEGGFLNFPMSIAGRSITVSLGVDGALLIDALKWLVQAPWALKPFSPQKLEEEFDLLDKAFLSRIKDSESPIELITLTVFVTFLNVLLLSQNLIHALAPDHDPVILTSLKRVISNFIPKLAGLAVAMFKQVVSLDIISFSKTPSFKSILTKFRDKLEPKDKFPFSYVLLDKLVNSMAGCDGISISSAVGPPSTLAGISTKVSYSYYVNPQFIGAGLVSGMEQYEANKSKKLILDMDSFSDFVDPDAYLRMGKTLGTNIGKAVVKGGEMLGDAAMDGAGKLGEGALAIGSDVLDTAKSYSSTVASGAGRLRSLLLTSQTGDLCPAWDVKRVIATDYAKGYRTVLICRDPSLHLGIGDSVAEFTGLDNFGPINFILRLANLANPNYLYDHCLKPGGSEAARVGSAIKDFFSTVVDTSVVDSLTMTDTATSTSQ